MTGWIVPVKNTKYPLNRNTFFITTESVTAGSDVVDLSLWTDSDVHITSISWRFNDWGYIIAYCTPHDYSLKFPVTPPTGVNKTWEITVLTDDVKVKCNALQVLHFIFNNTHNGTCTSKVKGKIATRIKFWYGDTATKKFKLDQDGE